MNPKLKEDTSCCILRVRGLPFSADQDDLENFFDNFCIVNTHIVLRTGKIRCCHAGKGASLYLIAQRPVILHSPYFAGGGVRRPTGEAYVQFRDSDEAALALQARQREHIGARYIELFDAVEASLLSASTGNKLEPSLGGHVARLRGLPFSSSAEDVESFLRPVSPLGGSHGIIFTCTIDGRPTGEAFIQVPNESDLRTCLSKDNDALGSRYIEVFNSCKGELYQAIHQRGFFTAVGGHRVYHPPLAGPGSDATSAFSQGRNGAALPSIDQLARGFASFGFVHPESPVSGPSTPRAFAPGQYIPIQRDHQYGQGQMHHGTQWAPRPAETMRHVHYNSNSSAAMAHRFVDSSRATSRQAAEALGHGDLSSRRVLVPPFLMQHQHPYIQQPTPAPGSWVMPNFVPAEYTYGGLYGRPTLVPYPFDPGYGYYNPTERATQAWQHSSRYVPQKDQRSAPREGTRFGGVHENPPPLRGGADTEVAPHSPMQSPRSVGTAESTGSVTHVNPTS